MKNFRSALMILLAISLQAFGQTPESGAAAKGPEGVWQGTLEVSGTQLRLVPTITKSASGGYSGKVDSLDQGSTIPIDVITFTGDAVRLELKSVGAEALAVADAIVAAIKDGIPENVPGPTSRAVPITLETVGGNYVILDLGQGRYAFYAHLQPGSLRVKAGDKVRRGQVVGLVGNSGNSTEPHLHFHISDANSPLGSDGLPYLLPAFEVQGNGWGWKAAEAKATTEKRQMEIPLENDVVRFPDTP